VRVVDRGVVQEDARLHVLHSQVAITERNGTVLEEHLVFAGGDEVLEEVV
jgi:hypothetical protein